MKAKKETWTTASLYCPNCGKKFWAHVPASGKIKSACASCFAVVVKTKIGRRHTQLDVYVPAGDL